LNRFQIGLKPNFRGVSSKVLTSILNPALEAPHKSLDRCIAPDAGNLAPAGGGLK
jgi:hypothetical protein